MTDVSGNMVSRNEISMAGRPKLDDTKAACNMIKRMRKQNRRQVKKSITIPLHIDDIKIGCNLIITYNPSTDCVSEAHSLKCKRAVVYPTVHQKLRCANQHALDLLEKERELTRKRRKRNKGYLKMGCLVHYEIL